MGEKHTPGPWRIDREHDEDEIAIVGKPTWGATRFGVKGEWDVCKVETDTSDSEGNARLIVECPQMHDVLVRLEPHLDAIVCFASTMDEYEPNRLASDVRALLARITPTPATSA